MALLSAFLQWVVGLKVFVTYTPKWFSIAVLSSDLACFVSHWSKVYTDSVFLDPQCTTLHCDAVNLSNHLSDHLVDHLVRKFRSSCSTFASSGSFIALYDFVSSSKFYVTVDCHWQVVYVTNE